MAYLNALISVLMMFFITFIPLSARAQTTDRTGIDTAQLVACPSFMPNDVQCHSGRSAAGALLFMAKPKDWNGHLIVFAHGGPRLGAIQLSETIEDLEKFQVLVRAGYAWAGTTYRRGGFGVRSAAQDVEDLRQIAWAHFGRPKRTILHGQSWGGNVAAKAAELFALDIDGKPQFDGVVLTSAVLAGGTRAYQLRADLRAVYQYYCNNHPKPDETAYPLWMGLPAGASMSRAELSRRVNECTGLNKEAQARSTQQRQNLSQITRVLDLKPDEILPNLVWATNTFQDLVMRLDGRNPFSNADRRYRGSSNDRALNAGVTRFVADPAAVAQLAYDSDLSGLIVAPTITLHGIADPVARACHQSAYLDTLTLTGRQSLLFQAFTSESAHSQLEPAAYPAAFDALVGWIETGTRPRLETVIAACQANGARIGQPCRILPKPRVPAWPC